jgi:AcrR family transcriptional regulator
MQAICREAGVSLGAVYVYFASKEELIAGITERDRSKLAAQLADVAHAPDILAALAGLGEHYMVEEPREKQQLVIEIGCESMHGGPVADIFRSVDQSVIALFENLFRRAEAEGKIAPEHDARTLAQTLAVLGDGLMWRRAVDPAFDAKTIVPIVTALIGGLLNPVSQPTPYLSPMVSEPRTAAACSKIEP